MQSLKTIFNGRIKTSIVCLSLLLLVIGFSAQALNEKSPQFTPAGASAGSWTQNRGDSSWSYTGVKGGYKEQENGNWQRVYQDEEGTVIAEVYDKSGNKISENIGGGKYGSKGVVSGIGGSIVLVVAWIIYGFAYVAGYLLSFLVGFLIQIAQFNHFIDVPTVVTGWVVIRDICNMFFVLILLFMAFATILRLPSYQIRQALPKFILMAILINFSRTIFGIIIDVGQVAMLSFVQAFAEYGGNEFIRIFQVTQYLSFDNSKMSVEALGFLGTLGALVAGFAAMLVTLVVVVVMVSVLVIRIIMLWLYTILSPLVFLGRAFPSIAGYTERIWGDFIKQVVSGPILAFFLWLALSTAQPSADVYKSTELLYSPFFTGGNEAFQKELDKLGANKDTPGVFSGLFTAENFQQYVLVIGLLIGGLMVTQQLGGAIGGMAGKGLGAIQNGKGLAFTGLKDTGYWAGRKLDTTQMGVQKWVATQLGGSGTYKPKTVNYRLIKKGWDTSRKEVMENYERQYGGGSNVWQDTFDKYMRVGQYVGLRKTKKRQTLDNQKAEQLKARNDILQARMAYGALSRDEAIEKSIEMEENKQQIINNYKAHKANPNVSEKEKVAWAQEQYEKDKAMLTLPNEWTQEETSEARKEVDQNRREIEKLLNEFRLGGFAKLPGAAPRLDYKYSAAGDKGVVDAKQKGISSRTDEESAAVVSELMDALAQKDYDSVAAAFKILAKNNDLNDALKDSRVVNVMTKHNGILERLAKSMNLNQQQTTDLIQDFMKNPVTPAYVHAMVKGMFDETGLDENTAARHAVAIGNSTIGAGNGLGYAMSNIDSNSGKFSFDSLKFKDNRLQITEDRQAAIVGKLNNFESQAKMRALHPDTLIAEAVDGSATMLHEGGVAFIKALTAHDLEQANRLRLDVIKKIGNSPQVYKQMHQIVKELESTGNTADAQQAKIIRYFGGYIKRRIAGGGMKEESDALKAFDNA